MSKVCHTCPMWTMIRGKEPQTEAEIDHWNCALGFLPTLLVENAQQMRQAGAATESFRNVMADGIAHSKLAKMAEKIVPHLVEYNPSRPLEIEHDAAEV